MSQLEELAVEYGIDPDTIGQDGLSETGYTKITREAGDQPVIREEVEWPPAMAADLRLAPAIEEIQAALAAHLREPVEAPASVALDVVNHPKHYTAYKGLEVIDLTEQLNFNRGNAIKYIARAGLKDAAKEIEDLEKSVWYIQREIARISA